jgi:hypothetical protein
MLFLRSFDARPSPDVADRGRRSAISDSQHATNDYVWYAAWQEIVPHQTGGLCMANNGRLTRAAVTFVTPAAALVSLAALPPTPAQAQAPGADLRILSPRAGDSLGANSFNLDVSFQSRSKSPVMTAELWVDGARWVRRDLDTPQVKNVLSFAVDTSTLTEGTHTFVIKVFTADGGSTQTQLQIQAGTNDGVREGSLSGPDLSFLTPGNGKRVSGSVDLTLNAQARNGINPYVTFYVDKQFKTLKNYPPYNYTWDTTTVPNGYHTIEAMGYLDDANATTTRRIKVYVDNPGGETKLQKDIPDLARGLGAASAVNTINMAPEKPAVSPRSTPAFMKPAPVLLPNATPARLSGGERKASASARSIGLKAAVVTPVAGVEPVVPGTTAAHTARVPSPAVNKKATASSAGVSAVAPKPAAVAGGVTAVSPSPLAVITPSAAMLNIPTFAEPVVPTISRPVRMNVAAPVRTTHLVPMATHSRSASQATPRAALRPASGNTLLGMMHSGDGIKPLQVAFDGQRIAFDVQPRVEAGLPIAPFRQIFEHTGGQVMWVPQTRVVRAVNADREVIITVGKKQAQVNGENVSMARPAYVEKGRTIVPLAFVGKALDVNVKYDPATGHLQITSKN